jgi:hypothetical protein
VDSLATLAWRTGASDDRLSPAYNGIMECFHTTLKVSLRARLQTTTWIQELPWVLLGHRAAVKQDLECSPAEMVFGKALLLPEQFTNQGAMTVQLHTFLHLTYNLLTAWQTIALLHLLIWPRCRKAIMCSSALALCIPRCSCLTTGRFVCWCVVQIHSRC